MPISSDKNLAIRVKNLSKTYTISGGNSKPDSIKALSNINMDIYKGEVIGIIGPNGSGKSTLLKIISEITAPDSGYVDIYGKVASILEVGTGFNPDLSGRKNIYLNARLHGMKKKEVDAKFEKIVKLFGFSNFLDTPVKHYSSGMYMRLAFAVVVHIDADIYLFDEVMSVGDVEFQEKAIKKIRYLNNQGNTILIVSHHLAQIDKICDTMCLFFNGKIIRYGNPYDVGMFYTGKNRSREIRQTHPTGKKNVKTPISINDQLLIDISNNIPSKSQVAKTLHITSLSKHRQLTIQIVLNRKSASHTISILSQSCRVNLQNGKTQVKILLNKNSLLEGCYSIDFFAFSEGKNIATKLELSDFLIDKNSASDEKKDNSYWIIQGTDCIMDVKYAGE